MNKVNYSALALAAALVACSTNSPDVVQREDAQRMSLVQDGTVLSARPVTVEGSQSGGGAVAGGVTGAVAGSAIGGGNGSAIAGILTAVAGAVVGNAVERNATKENAVELIVQLRNGERRSVVQAAGKDTIIAGDQVVMVTTGGKTRVTKAPVIVTPSVTPVPATPG